MRRLRVGVYECEPRPGAVDWNLARFKAALARAPLRDAELVVAPEMFATGWTGPASVADPARLRLEGRFSQLARERGVGIVTSLGTRRGGRDFNTLHVWDLDGRLLGTQDKMHLWDQERRRRSPGTSAAPIRTRWGRMAGMVCYDVEFPELARRLALEGAELFVVPSAFYSPTSWDIMTRARALENGCFLAAANQRGVDATLPHNGQSRIVGPRGEVLAEVRRGGRSAVAELDPSAIASARKWAPFLRDRRRDLSSA